MQFLLKLIIGSEFLQTQMKLFTVFSELARQKEVGREILLQNFIFNVQY